MCILPSNDGLSCLVNEASEDVSSEAIDESGAFST